MPTSADIMGFILCPEVTIVDTERTLTHKTRFPCPQKVYTNSSRSMLMSQSFTVMHLYRMIIWKQMCSGMDALDRHELLREPSVGIVPSLMQYGVSFSMALVLQL